MRYYCEYHPETINHTSPSVGMLDYILQLKKNNNQTITILDLGCGNGRNSLYLAKKYSSTNIVLVDSDSNMLDWAQKLFFQDKLPAKVICAKVEDLGAMEQPKFEEITGLFCFDIIIFSYVLQHIDPVYYPLIFDFCKRISRKYLAVDVFWNPTRLSPSEFTKIGSVNWYGLTHEELAGIVAPRFRILGDRVHRSNISIMINMLLTEGQTPVENIIEFDLDYYSGQIRRQRLFRPRGLMTEGKRKLINIHDLECTKLLFSLYPTKMDFVSTELNEWMQEIRLNGKTTTARSFLAAKFLWLCRTNKVPVLLHEVTRDFEVRTNRVLQILSETNYIPSLSVSDYIGRISRQFGLPESISNQALSMVEKSNLIDSTSPITKACCYVIRAAELERYKLARYKVASIFGVSTVGINLALKRDSFDAPPAVAGAH